MHVSCMGFQFFESCSVPSQMSVYGLHSLYSDFFASPYFVLSYVICCSGAFFIFSMRFIFHRCCSWCCCFIALHQCLWADISKYINTLSQRSYIVLCCALFMKKKERHNNLCEALRIRNLHK